MGKSGNRSFVFTDQINAFPVCGCCRVLWVKVKQVGLSSHQARGALLIKTFLGPDTCWSLLGVWISGASQVFHLWVMGANTLLHLLPINTDFLGYPGLCPEYIHNHLFRFLTLFSWSCEPTDSNGEMGLPFTFLTWIPMGKTFSCLFHSHSAGTPLATWKVLARIVLLCLLRSFGSCTSNYDVVTSRWIHLSSARSAG